uniref:Desmoplakin-like n=1 Tax=Gouania willdenowi TaxID=441366 RepID=A0A8C5DZN5_GOUWI
MASWGDDPAAIEQQLVSHQKFQNSIQRSSELDRAREELSKKGDKGNLYALDQEWDTLQQMSHGRAQQLRELLQIIEEISREIMWVNDREEEELVFDWGDKNVEQYIPRKQEAYSKLMSALEDKEKQLNKLKTRVDNLLKNGHPAADKIEAYQDTLQTQWSWLLQITKCIDTHLKENGAYSQFFKMANETYMALQKEHESVRKKFACDKNTSLDNLLEMLKSLEREKEKITEHKRQVQHLVSKSRSIVRLKPRNPEDKSSSGVIVKALCDFKQDQKVICKNNEAILKDNSQRSKWLVTGPGGLDMMVPSVCLIVPPPNPLSISLANKNEQYYEAILSIWNQLLINVKSLIAWQYCTRDINYINSLTISVLSKMRPEEYRQIFKSMETNYEDFILNSHGSQMFVDDDKKNMEQQFHNAQTHYDQLLVRLPTYGQCLSVAHTHIRSVSVCSTHTYGQCLSVAHTHIRSVSVCSTHTYEHLTFCCAAFYVHYHGLWFMSLTDKLLSEIKTRQTLNANRGRGTKLCVHTRLRALREMLDSMSRAEDIIKVHEARLTEKETTSLSPQEVEEYVSTLKNIKADLDQRKDVLASMETELTNACRWDRQVGGPFHRCDLMLSKYKEDVRLLLDRWKRIQGQIDTRLQDLQLYLPQLQHYQKTSSDLSCWIDATRKKQDILLGTQIDNVQYVFCFSQDYESDLNSYTSGLETLLNIPIKRTMLRSPAMDLNQEAIQMQTRYMALLTQSADYYKFLGALLKNMEELKIRNTRIELLEEELRRLKDGMQDHSDKNKSMEDALARYKLELSQSQTQLLSMQEVKQSSALQYGAAKRDLDDMQGQIAGLKEELEKLKYLLEEEKRKKNQAEERYSQQKDDYELMLRKKQSELEKISWSNRDVEKEMGSKDHEIELLRRQLADEAAKVKELQKEIAKVRSQCSVEMNNLKLSYDTQINVSHTNTQQLAAQRDEENVQLKLRYDRMEVERRGLEEDLLKLRASLSKAEEFRKRAEEEAQSQRSVILEEGHRRRELESQVESLMLQRNQDSSQFREELEEVLKALEEKKDQLNYVKHKLEEEIRWRKTTEEGQAVLEQTVSELQLKITKLSKAATQLKEYEEELETTRLELEREKRERSRMEQNISTLQSRIRDVQLVRDRLEGQVNDLRNDNQEEASRRRQLEADLEKMTLAVTEYSRTITTLRESQEQVCSSEKRGEEERLRLQKELEQSLKQNRSSEDTVMRLSSELKALQQQLLQEHVHVKDLNSRNQELSRALEEKTKALNLSSAEVQRLKEMTETLTKDKLRLEEELRSARHDKEELLRTKRESDDELSSQITALELQLKTSERHNADYRNLVSELSSEREKLMVETEKIQKEASESQYESIVSEKETLMIKFQTSEKDQGQTKQLEEELMRIRMSSESDLRDKERLQQENERMKMDVNYWKDQCESKQVVIKQCDADKEGLERDKQSLKSEIERLMRELRTLEESYKSKLLSIQQEMQEVAIVKQTMESQLKQSREAPTMDASTLIFDGVRKSVTANQLLDCGVLDKQAFDLLVKGQRTVPELSADKRVYLKGTGPIAGVVIENSDSSEPLSAPFYKLTLSEAKNENLLPPECADLLLDAQAATGYIIDARTNQKFTVDEACDQSVVDSKDRKRLLAAEAAAVGYTGQGRSDPLSVFQAMKQGVVDKNQALRLLQAQESVGGILDPALSVLLPKETAIERQIIDDGLCRALNQKPKIYLDPETMEGVTYDSIKKKCKVEPHTGILLLPVSERIDPSKLVFDGVRKPVTAKQLLECNVLERPMFRDLEKGKKSVPEVSEKKKTTLKGTGPIAGVIAGSQGKMSLSEAKKQMLLPEGVANFLLEAQAATGHIIDPQTNQKLTVEEACIKEVVDIKDRDKLLAAEGAAIGYNDPNVTKPISVFEAMNKGIIDKVTGLRLLQAQESVGGILDPNLSVFLPKDTAIKRQLIDEKLHCTLNQDPQCYLDPETECNISYGMLKKRCMTESNTGLLLLPISERIDPSKLIFDGVRKMSLSEAKKQMLLPSDSADYLLEAQAATGYIIDPQTDQKLTVEEACDKGVVDIKVKNRLLTAESAAVGFRDPKSNKLLSVFEAMKRGIVDDKTALRLLQAQESVGGILDPNLSVFLPKDIALKRNLLDTNLHQVLSRGPPCYLDPEVERVVSYGALKKRCKTEPYTELKILPVTERMDASKIIFDGVRKSITAQQLFDCGVIDKTLLSQLIKGEKSVQDVSVDKRVFLKGTGSIAGLAAGPSMKMSFTEAKNQNLMPSESADQLLIAQAATGSIIDPRTNQKLNVKEACAKGVVNKEDQSMLFAAEAAAIGYRDSNTPKLLSAGQAFQKGLIDKNAALRLLQAQEAAGGILDPELSVTHLSSHERWAAPIRDGSRTARGSGCLRFHS